MKKDIPVKKNEKYTVQIEGFSSDGNGIAKIDGYIVFVPGTAAGDCAEILIVKTKSAYGFGKLLKLISPSPKRCEPPCSSFKRCGGCQLMHISYDEQLILKAGTVNDALRRIGGLEGFETEPIIGMDNPLAYRNKTVFPIGRDKNGKTVCGFYAQRSHEIIPLGSCPIGPPANREIIPAVLEYMNEYGVAPYDELTHKGLVRRLYTRFGKSSGEIMVILSVNGKSIPHENAFVQKILKASGNIASIILNINTNRTNLVLGGQNRTLYGKSAISDTLLENSYEISPHSFYQVNPVQTRRLYEKALEYADITPEDHVLDIYCGIGTISLSCAKTAKHVTGVEIVPEAVKNAEENAKRNGISNAEFYCSDASELVPVLIENGERPDIVILDPPRKGSDPNTLKAVCTAKPEKIVYVSCNPATLARDAAELLKYGYTLKKVCPVDMFPMTTHVETVVLLQKKNS